MLEQFIAFIKEQELIDPGKQILLAVSGGLDSMVMLQLFHRSGYRFGIAHCNFQLRGEESDEDQRFVESMSCLYGVPFYTTRFTTTNYAESHKVSIQVAARELRYAWFEEIRTQGGFDLIATAHHQDDQIETLFINLLRGTGIAGLHGIPVRNGHVIRPLLFTSREEILPYAKEHKLTFREDSSNSSLTYARNRIRHQLIPMLKSIDPDYSGHITATIRRIQGAESILKPLVDNHRKKLIRQDQGRWVIEINDLLKLKPLHTWMYEILSPFEFNETAIRNLVSSFGQESGKTFYSPSFRIIKDRGQLIITTLPGRDHEKNFELILIDENTEGIETPVRLSIHSISREKGYQISVSKNTATLDRKKLHFPLTLRKWRPGDWFFPLGMNRQKKLSDFFIDEKIPIPDKENCWLLCSGNHVVWVTGHRIDHRYRVTERTKELLVVDLMP